MRWVLVRAGLYLSSTTGYSSRETRQVYCGGRAEELAASGPSTAAHIHFLYGRWRVDLGRGGLSETLTSAVRLHDAVTRPVTNEGGGAADFFVRDEAGVGHRQDAGRGDAAAAVFIADDQRNRVGVNPKEGTVP